MKLPFPLMVTTLSLVLSLAACDNSTDSDDPHDFPDPIESEAQNIELSIYSVYNDSLLQISTLPAETTLTVVLDDSSATNGHGLNIYASAEGYYSQYYYRNDYDTLTIDLDSVPQTTMSITGTIVATQPMWHSCYYANRDIYLSGLDGGYASTTTDSQGRFGLGNLPVGEYTLILDYSDPTVTLDIVNSNGTDYYDLDYEEVAVVEAPYIYLYPEHTTDISVRVDILCEGTITESEPEYNSGWNVNVNPEGIINGQYDYLFYEGAIILDNVNCQGWVLDGGNLEQEMRSLLEDIGFAGREIDDFVDFWQPRIEGHAYYAFYYQEPKSLIRLDVTPVPPNILRAFFIIRPLENDIILEQPEINDQFNRDGFTLVEWGVIDWRE